jgi:hypothetical protein
MVLLFSNYAWCDGIDYLPAECRFIRPIITSILNAVQEHDPYFVQKRDAASKLGLSVLQKFLATFRQLEYGYSSDAVDEYVKIGKI